MTKRQFYIVISILGTMAIIGSIVHPNAGIVGNRKAVKPSVFKIEVK